MINNISLSVFLCFVVWLAACNKPITDQPQFELLSSQETAIDFVNRSGETEAVNIFTYEYLYNGGGVALGDINNDGLPDIYLGSNNQANRLYLNKGDFQFQDITDDAGVASRAGWKTGVAMVDINGDGWLDIYVCRSADLNAENRENLMYINNGNLTFTESSKPLMLNDDSYSTHAAFFDYDRDGDLDVFSLNHSLIDLSNSQSMFFVNKKTRYPHVGNRFLRNDNGRFTEIADEIGIYGPSSNYGLGIVVSDINNDGWPDIYVSNDYKDNDKLYINDQKGNFQDRSYDMLSHMSNFSMGADIVDLNHDGHMDIFTLDMLPGDNKRQKQLFGPDNFELFDNQVKTGYHYQYMRNMLHLNNGNNTFSEVGQLSGISNTDWSWAALFADLNHDGFDDLLVTNGYKRDYTNNDFLNYKADQQVKRSRADSDADPYLKMLEKMPSNKLNNYVYQYKGDLQFQDVTSEWGFDAKTLSNGAAWADLDADGDLDIVINNIDQPVSIYRNNLPQDGSVHYLKVTLKGEKKNTFGLGAKVTVFVEGRLQKKELNPYRGFQSSVEPILHFGLGANATVDSLIVQWISGKKETLYQVEADRLVTLEEKNAKVTQELTPVMETMFSEMELKKPIEHLENDFNDFKVQPLLPKAYSTQGPAVAYGDVDGDGQNDLFVGGAMGQPGKIYHQIGDRDHGYTQITILNEEIRGYEDVDAAFFDADGDGDNDLYVASGGYEILEDSMYLADRLYLYDAGKWVLQRTLPGHYMNSACVTAIDIDRDGSKDLFIGGGVIPGNYPRYHPSRIYKNNGKGVFSDLTSSALPSAGHFGIISDAVPVDINTDGMMDLVLVGDWIGIKILVNQEGGFLDKTGEYLDQRLNGWWNKIHAFDFEQDGDTDFVVGNFGLNSQVKPSLQEPVTLVYHDYDNNGSIDPLLNYYIQGKSWPYASLDELSRQVVTFKKRFQTYNAYAEATINEILTPQELSESSVLKAYEFRSLFLENINGKLVSKPLPVEAQAAPVYAIQSMDVNGDHIQDLLLAGNLSKSKVRTGKYTGNNGVLLMGKEGGAFEYVPQYHSGFNIQGDVRELIKIPGGLLFIVNDGQAKWYVQNK